jgi:hypothetical protein
MSSSTSHSSPVPEGTVVSLMIPWVELWVTSGMVLNEFMCRPEKFRWGEISKVDMVTVGSGKRPHKMVFMHFSSWNPNVQNLLDHLSSPPKKEGGRVVWPELKETNVLGTNTYWIVRKSNWKPKVASEAPSVDVAKPEEESGPSMDGRVIDDVKWVKVLVPPPLRGLPDSHYAYDLRMFRRQTPEEQQRAIDNAREDYGDLFDEVYGDIRVEV